MKKIIKIIAWIIPILLILSCQGENATETVFPEANLSSEVNLPSESNLTSDINTSLGVLTGFNQNFSMMPDMTEAMYQNIVLLKPKMLRYPGGTVTHSWDWKQGIITSRNASSVHHIDEIKTLTDRTGAKFVFVLDILNSALENQIEMLTEIEKLGVQITHIELGNELYAKEEGYPTAEAYAQNVNQWIPELRKKFPKAKIAALLLGRKVTESNARMFTWNRTVVDNTINDVNAYTYHIYIGTDSTFEKEKAEFIEVSQNAKTNDKEIWITEYGNQHDKNESNYYTELSSLADFVESYPPITIALNHQIVGGTKNKLTEDGSGFVEEGKLFLERVETTK